MFYFVLNYWKHWKEEPLTITKIDLSSNSVSDNILSELQHIFGYDVLLLAFLDVQK